MASTTKIWTLDLTSNFLAMGVVHLDDKVTIDAFEAGVGGSLMVDVFKKPLEAGEVVKFRDLVRGMIYQSGNNAAYAIAGHIAQAYWAPTPTGTTSSR
jgi:D-alanyl-D-alanine carboxypeptidase (penicillin-binding protein 5/6)